MSWASFLKLGGKWVGRGAKTTVETVGHAAIHPQQTLKGAGTAMKTAAVGGTLGYVGWQKLTTDDSVVGIVSDALIGEKNSQAISDTVHGTADGIRDLKDSVSNMTDTVTNTMDNVDSNLNGVSNFLGSITSGNGGDMLGNFFCNLTHGNVSGLSIMGLVLSAFLLFGRFGWMGKIAGAVLAMMMIGNNARAVQQQTPAVQPVRTQATPQETANRQQEEAEAIHRSRR